MKLTQSQAAAIRKHARAEYPRECCGLIVNDLYRPLKNVHPTPLTHFKIAPQDLKGVTYSAVVHSHPDGLDMPSAADLAAQRASGVPWVIVKVTEHGCKVPFILGNEAEPLIGRRFRYGVNDCFTLIRDWLQTQGQGHLAPEINYDWNWWSKGESLYMDNYAAAGWIETVSPTAGCVGFMKTMGSPVPNHAAVLTGDGWLLHHQQGHLSKCERAELWLPSFRMWIRHPDFVLKDD